MHLRSILIIFWLGAHGISAAEQALPPLVVQAPFQPAHLTDPEFGVGQTRVIHRSQFRGHHHNLADVLQQLPEVQVQRSGELGSFSSLSIRGAPSRQTLVFVDGIQVTTAESGVVNLSQFSLHNVEAIEIYSTAPPAQMAQASIGGAINIITRKDEVNDASGSLKITQGSFGQSGAEAQASWRQGAWRLRSSGHLQSANNDFSYLAHQGTPYNSDNHTQERRRNAGFQALGGSLVLMHQGQDQQLQWSLAADTSHKELPTWHNKPIDGTFYRASNLRTELQWAQAESKDWPLATSLRGFWQQSQGQLRDLSGAISWQGNDTRDQTQVVGLNLVMSTQLGDHELTLASEARQEHFALDNRDTGQGYAFDRQMLSLSLADSWMPLPADLTLLSQLRLIQYQDEAESDQDLRQHWGGQLGGRWQWPSGTIFKTNLTRLHRVPSLFERYGNQGNFRGNAALTAETADAWDLSMQASLGDLAWELGHFLRFSRDAIAPTYNAQGIGRYVNIGDAWFQGIEAQAEWPWAMAASQWSLGGFASVQRSQVSSPFRAYNGKQVPGYYPLSWGAQLAWQYQQTSAELQWRHDSGLYFDRANSTQAPDKQRLNLSLRQQFVPRAAGPSHGIELGVLNLFDAAAMDFNRSPLPGRSFFLSYQLNL